MKPYYSEGGITIYHGDCREVLPTLDLAGAVCITDPPYGIDHESNHVCETTTAPWMNSTIANDNSTEARDQILSRFADWVCFASFKAPAPTGYRGLVIWDKGPASGMGDLSFPWKASFEPVYIAGSCWSGRRDEGVLKDRWIVTRASMGRVHPNEKPISLMAEFIDKTPAEATIVDPFAGSGSTLVAAKLSGRKAIGIEIEERYCEIAAKRLAQGVLFGGGAA